MYSLKVFKQLLLGIVYKRHYKHKCYIIIDTNKTRVVGLQVWKAIPLLYED